ncbi:hypothetical protein SSP35_16_00180 [Streptomyces sp. NBRC 110611]|uniref:hypothetical protein n=1 Tax=Streptomyces sp. NBRC 110611 TaxID=1621259 RepID=UPI00083663CD|nr:hypothetical protein [Streptomyces sp. NBRC 110611]GAU70023.1 hypothetical protein SSP35_16_00180 [Streptomyces sp. NBRC 110611]
MKPEYRDCFLPFLHPGERLVIACDYWPNTALPSVPAELRTPQGPPAQSKLEERVRGVLGNALGKVARPLEAVTGSRLVNNPLTRAAGRVGDRIERTTDALDHAADRAVEKAIWGTVMDGGWQSMAGRFLVNLTNAGGDPRRQALTDRRLILLVDHGTGRRDAAPQWAVGSAVPRPNIARIDPHPKALAARGRFDVTFVDGSWIALGSAVRAHMEAFVAAAHRGG